MICLNCKKQIPDDSQVCRFCGEEINHKRQLPKEISLRRYQRWGFYAVIIIVFVGMVGVILKIYNANAKLLLNINGINEQLKEKDANLEKINEDLSKKENLIKEIENNLNSKSAEVIAKEEELLKKTEEYKAVLEEKTEVKEGYEKCELDLNLSEANIYNLIIKLGEGVSSEDLEKIQLAEANFGGEDADEDGLSSNIENALGTDKDKKDTDDDGYDDKSELLSGYNPINDEKLNLDLNYADQQKGKILLQVEGGGDAWYISPSDGKKYFLGNPTEGFRTMRSLEYWTEGLTGEEQTEEDREEEVEQEIEQEEE